MSTEEKAAAWDALQARIAEVQLTPEEVLDAEAATAAMTLHSPTSILWTAALAAIRAERERAAAQIDEAKAHAEVTRKELLDMHDALHAECKPGHDAPAEIRALRRQLAEATLREKALWAALEDTLVWLVRTDSISRVRLALSAPAPSLEPVIAFIRRVGHTRDCLEMELMQCRCGKDAALRALGEEP